VIDRAEVERALGALVGEPLWDARRAADQLALHLGARHGGEEGPVGALVLHVACAWRATARGEILVASGDLLTPADPDAELESFDWDEPGATLWDLRWRSVLDSYDGEPPVVERAAADDVGGFSLALTGGLALDVFPNSSESPHVETEFWRLVQHAGAEPHLAVGTFGVERGRES
jgi:hypothetical protein